MMVPAAASIAPTMQAIAMRGRRIDHSTSRSRSISAGSPAVRPAAAISRCSGIPAAPMVAAIVAVTMRATHSTVTTMTGERRA